MSHRGSYSVPAVLFSIYTIEMTSVVTTCSIDMYADDTALYAAALTPLLHPRK